MLQTPEAQVLGDLASNPVSTSPSTTVATDTGWELRGSGVQTGTTLVLSEDPHLLSRFTSTFTLPKDAKVLHFIIQPHLVANSGTTPPDAFEIALLDPNSFAPLAGTAAGLTQTDALLNVQQDGQVFFSPLVKVAGFSASGQTASPGMPLDVTIDLSGVAPGTRATADLDLLAFGPVSSSVTVHDLGISTQSGTGIGGDGGGGGGGGSTGGSGGGGGNGNGGGTAGSSGSSGSAGSVGAALVRATGGSAGGIAAASASDANIVRQPGGLPESHPPMNVLFIGDQSATVQKGRPMVDGGGDDELDDFWPWLWIESEPGPGTPEQNPGTGAPTGAGNEGATLDPFQGAVDAIMREAAAAQPAMTVAEMSGLRSPSTALAAVDALFAEGLSGSADMAAHDCGEGQGQQPADALSLFGAGLLGSLTYLTPPRTERPAHRSSRTTSASGDNGDRLTALNYQRSWWKQA
jgi:hypothetical protein